MAGSPSSDEGIRAALVSRRQFPDVAVLVLSQYVEESYSNTGIVAELKVSPSAVEKYVTSIFLKLDLPPTGTDHRRVLAVLKDPGA